VTQINDMLIGALDDLGQPDFEEIAADLPYYEVAGHLLKRERMTLSAGKGIKRTLMYKMSDLVRHIDRYSDTDEVSFQNVLAQLSAEWCTLQVPWAVEEREPLMNRGKALVADILKPRQTSAMLGLADDIEDKVWTVRLPGSDKYPNGIPYWLVKNATYGYNGGYPGTHTDIAGVNLTTVETFKNLTGSYVNVAGPDLIRKMARACTRDCRWHSPFGLSNQLSKAAVNRFRIYCNDDTADLLEDYVDATNQQHGSVIAEAQLRPGGKSSRGLSRNELGDITMRRHPIVPLPILNDDAENPVYGVDWNTFQFLVLAGDYLRRSGPYEAFDRHFWKVWWVSLTYQIICVNRRRNFVFHKP